ncbi:MAG: ATP-dependent helicase, partial [Acidimicrobiia bacterium]
TGMPGLLTGPEQVAMVRRLLGDEDPADWPASFRGLLPTQTFANEVTDFLLRCQEQLIDASELERRAADRADWRRLPAFLDRYLAALTEQGRIDYGTLQAQAVLLLDDPEVQQRVGGQYRYLLVDEYQDTTIAQARLLERLYLTHRNLTVAGDPYQSIYSFRGTELHNIGDFPERFTDSKGEPARRLVLTTSFRVPAEILRAAARVTSHIDLPGGAGRVRPAPGRGSVETYGFDQQSHEAEWIAEELQRVHLLEKIPYRRMAVLVRSKRRFLPELSRALDRRRIPHDRPDARLVDHPAARLVLDCVIAATESGGEEDQAARRILLGPLFSLPLARLRELQRERARTGAAWPHLIRRSVQDGEGLADLLTDPGWAAQAPAAEGFWRLWSELPQFASIVADPARRDDLAAWSSLSQVLNRLRERDARATLQDYLRWSEQEEFEATPLLGFRPPDEDRLTLTTLHQAKGVEFDLVVIADAREGVFPDLRPRESLLGSRHLSPTQPTEASAYARFRLQEETRLAYTAMCRARRRVVWTATALGFDEGQGMPSRFLPLVAGVDTVAEAARRPPERTEAATPLEAEAWLRRIVRDPGRGQPIRLAALAALVRGADWMGRRPETFAGILVPGPDHGLVPPDLSFSPSQAEGYLQCPRQYAFRQWLHVGDEPTVYATFGSLIHEVLREAEQTAVERGDRHATIDEALAVLGRHWEPGDFGGSPWADAWRRRAEDTLRHLYEHWPSTAAPAALERSVELEIEETPWRGRIDRLEVESGRVGIVDYKTSRRPISVDEAASSVQLGFYFLAAGADREIAALGEIGSAEFWYPSQTHRRSVTRRTFDPRQIAVVEQRLQTASVGIESEDWRPIPGDHCDWCAVRLVCPAWPEGREAYSA